MKKYNLLLVACAESRNNFFENLGVERITPFLKNHGYQVEYEYIFGDMSDSCLEQLCKYDIVAFSVYPDTYNLAREYMKYVKKHGKFVIAGGKYATDNYAEILTDISDIDAICLGHGEIPYLMMLDMLAKGELFGQCLKKIPFFATRNKVPQSVQICVSDINDLCIPDRKKYFELIKIDEVFICDSHGCTGRCTFCSNCQNMRRYSTRTMEDVVAEIEDLHKTYGITQFNLMGNSFEDPGKKGKRKINEFCDLIIDKKMKISLGCYIKGDFINSEEDKLLLDKMVSAGFTHIFIGVETANEKDLALYRKRANKKNTEELLHYLDKYSSVTLVSCGFIMINPFTTLEQLKDNYCFLSAHNNYNLANYISRLLVYTNTDMQKICEEEGVLLPEFDSHHPLSYKIINSDVKLIYQYIQEKLIPFQNQQSNILDTVRNIYGIRGISNQNSDLDCAFFKILDEIAALLRGFFYHLYVDNDIDLCQRMFQSWEQKMKEAYKKLYAVEVRYKIQYMRNRRLSN